MKIILDVMSGSNAPRAAVLGAIDAVERFGIEITLVGREKQIQNILRENGRKDLPPGTTIVNSGDGAGMHDSVIDIAMLHRSCSVLTGLRMLPEGNGDAFMSAVSIDSLLADVPMREEIYTLLAQAAEKSLVVIGSNVLIRSLGETSGFIGGRLRQMLKKNKRAVFSMLRGKLTVGDLMKLMNRRDLIHILRVRKPVVLLHNAADEQMFFAAIEQMIRTMNH